MNIIKASSYEQMSRHAANIIAAQITLKPTGVIGLATGSTPIGTYDRLVELYQQGDLDFSGLTTVNLDEYCGLAPDHPQSYRYFMEEYLLSKVNVAPENTHVPSGNTDDIKAECRAYDELIKAAGGIDLQLLGIGHNGHIGFNEPADHFPKGTHSVSLKEGTIDANTRFFESRDEVPRTAITMGIKTIMDARKVLLIASGAEKMAIVDNAINGPITPEVPASILQLHPDLTVIICED